MLPECVLDRFVEKCPAAVMVRATLEHLMRPERLDQIFEAARQRQYQKQLLFSQLVAVMSAVANSTAAVRACLVSGRQGPARCLPGGGLRQAQGPRTGPLGRPHP